VETKYLRMIRGMKRRGRKDWTVYILRCGDGSLYTGIAKDVRTRVKQHSEGRGATYTRTRLPVKLLYQQEGLTHSKALIREAQIKAMPRSKKEEIIFIERTERITPAGGVPAPFSSNIEAIKRRRAWTNQRQRKIISRQNG